MIEVGALQSLCREARSTMDFEGMASRFAAAQEQLAADPDLPPFQKVRLAPMLAEGIALLERRRKDPAELFRALDVGISPELRERWVSAVYEEPSAAVGDDLIRRILAVRQDTAFDPSELLKRALMAAQRVKLFAAFAIDIERTRRSVVAHQRQLRSSSVSSDTRADVERALQEFAAALVRIEERSRQTVLERFEFSMEAMEKVVAAAGQQLDEDRSYAIQVVLLTSRELLRKDVDLAERPGSEERLDQLEDIFSACRFRGPGIVFRDSYEPQLRELRAAAQTSTDFKGLRRRVKDLEGRAGRAAQSGVRGRDRIAGYHRRLVTAEAKEIREFVRRREADGAALFLELRKLEEDTRELDARPYLTHSSVGGIRAALVRAKAWAATALPAIEARRAEAASTSKCVAAGDSATIPAVAPPLRALHDALGSSGAHDTLASKLLPIVQFLEDPTRDHTRLDWPRMATWLDGVSTEVGTLVGEVHAWIDRLERAYDSLESSIDSKLDTYVLGLAIQVEQLAKQIVETTDLHTASEELAEMGHLLEAQDIELRPVHLRRLRSAFQAGRTSLWKRITDTNEIDRLFTELDESISIAAKRLGRFEGLDALEANAKSLGWRVDQLPKNLMPNYSPLVRRTYGRIRGLRIRREEILRARDADQAAALAELTSLVSEAVAAAQANPASHDAWDALVEAQRQLRESHVLAPAHRQRLQVQLDAGFQQVRAARAAFAQTAAIVYCRYADAIQNIQQALESGDPRPGRAEAFDAIEQIKPIRAQLREERHLLRRHREELYSALRTVSDAISEILEAASKEAVRQLAALERGLDALATEVNGASTLQQIEICVYKHRDIAAELRTATLPMEGRRACRNHLSLLFDQLVEKREAAGRNRFTAANIDATMARLESQGNFLWMRGVPRIG